MHVEAYANALISCNLGYVLLSQDLDGNASSVFNYGPMSILVHDVLCVEYMIHFKHVECYFSYECIVLTRFCLILSNTYLMGDVSWNDG